MDEEADVEVSLATAAEVEAAAEVLVSEVVTRDGPGKKNLSSNSWVVN